MEMNKPYKTVLYAFVKNHEGISKKELIKTNSNLPAYQSILCRC